MSKATNELLVTAAAILESVGENETLAGLIESVKALGEDANGNVQECKDLKALVESLSPKPDPKPEPEKKIKCIVRSLDKEENEMVFGHNGKITQIKLGEEIELSRDNIKVIKAAVIAKHEAETDKDGNPTGKTRVKDEPRYLVEVVI